MARRDLTIDWKKYYEERHGTMEDAAKIVENGDCVWLSNAQCIPYAFLDYLHEHKEDYHDVMLIYNCMNMPCDMIFDPESKKHFRMFSAFNLPLERMSIGMNIAECGGMTYDLFPYGPFAYDCNVAAIQVCPPDEDGWCNVGAYQVCTHHGVTQDPRVVKKIGFMDPTGQYPVPGDRDTHFIHITEFDCIVDNPTELVSFPSAPPTEYDKMIAENIMPYIHDGDKIQIGFGGLGEEILKNLRGVGHVEVYSEVACESMMDLCKEGIITKITVSSPAACSKEFFEFARDDDRIRFLPHWECIDALGIVKQENIVAINATFMIDLLGQACSEAQGLSPYSGPGGSFGYLYGSIRSKGGRSFLCLRSTYVDREGERHSNIVPWLPEGCIVTTPKVFVMYVVTEYGVADVFMKTVKDRIRSIIKVAHPDYRKELMEKIITTPLINEDDFEGYDPFNNVK
ncbi:MAG: hypothetical protein GXY01_00440 [Clostridiales bacterium]|jgi:acyl-CoA hydrolase|nr:hypothetical protein [Clostridiales bacterium]